MGADIGSLRRALALFAMFAGQSKCSILTKKLQNLVIKVIDVLTGIMRLWYHIGTVFQVANIAASILGLVHSPLWYCAS